MKKIIAVSLCVSLFGAGCFSARPPVQSVPTESPSSAERETSHLIFLRLDGGTALVERAGEKKAAEDGAELATGDRVTVTNGAIFIVYPDAGMTRLDQGSDVTILSDTAARGILTELRVASGRAWTRFERVLGAQEQFSVAANSVVATVRGTAFGVSVLGEEVDVQVAEREVEVGSEIGGVGATLGVAQLPTRVVQISAGEGISLRAKQIAELNDEALRSKKRKLSTQEKTSEGYRFASQRLDTSRVQRPAILRQLFKRAPASTPELERRQFFLRQSMLRRLEKSGFVAPTRSLLPGETAPTNVAPSVTGPGQQ